MSEVTMLVCQEFGKINSPRSAIVNIELQHNEVILEEIHGWDLSDVSALVHGTNVDNVRNTHHCYVFPEPSYHVLLISSSNADTFRMNSNIEVLRVIIGNLNRLDVEKVNISEGLKGKICIDKILWTPKQTTMG